MTETLKKLEELAHNVWWSWNPDVLELFRDLNPRAFRDDGNNPVAALRTPHKAILNGPEFRERVNEVYARFRSYMDSPGELSDRDPVAYFCMEFGIHESMPMYSGGLGILAGDHIKSASDLGLPLTGIGLLVKEGYLFQQFDASGWQQSLNPVLSLDHTPLRLVTNGDGSPLTVTVDIADEQVDVCAWSLQVGRCTLYYLDTDLTTNSPDARRITKRLYDDGPPIRIRQEMVLGIAGVRLLRALGLDASVYHLNEGHCSLVTLELLREQMDSGQTISEAEGWVRKHVVFTTHTPVPAGHDRFEPILLDETMPQFATSLGFSIDDMAAYGREHPGDPDGLFNLTILGLRLSRSANGVSSLNGEVSRAQWHRLFMNGSANDVPIGHITNGIHIPTWISPDARRFIEKVCGPLDLRRSNPEYWAPLGDLPDDALWELRTRLRRELVYFATDRISRGTLPQTCNLDPEALTIGFARRLAPYKRALLIFSDFERAARLFGDSDRPIQLIMSGKAHPHNDTGKAFIRRIAEVGREAGLRGRVVFLENYDIEIGRMLVSGCDVWLNNPRRPKEASGTSGQKIGVHGGLNLSILDGWWPEGYNGNNGWAIGDGSSMLAASDEEQDAIDAALLYDTLEQQVVPAFYERNEDGLPLQWTARMREALTGLPAPFSATRMVRQYADELYRHAGGESEDLYFGLPSQKSEV
ncbi:MAG: alpha-glucan family phosphorylase [Candidatus Latescibacterota bacterium]|jgi:starch phosphorylase/maltose phosphorylase